MLNPHSIDVLQGAQWTSHFRRPIYDSYSFLRIPQTVTKLLTGEGEKTLPVDAVGGCWEVYDCVVLFLIDGFGWEFFEGFMPTIPFLHQFLTHGVASKISSQFPSTTANHMTTINTDLSISKTGIYEWFYYEPKVGEIIAPLPFSYAGDHTINTLSQNGFNVHQLFPFETFYQKLHHKGVKSVVVQQEEIAHSPYSRAMFAGADIVPYKHFSEALSQVKTLCVAPKRQPTYIFVYFGKIDSAGHRYGISSPQFFDAVHQCWNAVEKELWQECTTSKKIAFLFTADHGMVSIDPKTTVYLNQSIPDINDMLKRSVTGKPLAPAGSCRDLFLHCKTERLEEMQAVAQECLLGKADVVRTEELLNAHFFGPESPSKRLKDRIGNLVILPYLGESVWWFEKHRFEQHFVAAHGGLTPQELESILLFLKR